MHFDTLPVPKYDRVTFEGLRGMGDGSVAAAHNLCNGPGGMLHTRSAHGIGSSLPSFGGIVACDGEPVWISGSSIVFHGTAYDIGITPGTKRLTKLGKYIIIHPDKVYFNTLDPEDFGTMVKTYTSCNSTTLTLCGIDGSSLLTKVTDTEPTTTHIGAMWVDTSVIPNVVRVRTALTWVEVKESYVRIDAPQIDRMFEVGDGVKVDDCTFGQMNGYTRVVCKGDDFIVVVGVVQGSLNQRTPITVSLNIPDAAYVSTAGGRLWCCARNNGVDRICASKPGDPFNFNYSSQTADDSFRTDVFTDGVFTGAATLGDTPVFFKQNVIHRVKRSGKAFTVTAYAFPGADIGCGETVCTMGEKVYYCASDGVRVYDGRTSVLISGSLGDVSFAGAVACVCRGRYIVSVGGKAYIWSSADSAWTTCDCASQAFAVCGDKVYWRDIADGRLKCFCFTPDGFDTENDCAWNVTSVPVEVGNSRRVSSVSVCGIFPASAQVVAEYSDGTRDCFTVRSSVRRTFELAAREKKCGSVRVSVCGIGAAAVGSIGVKTRLAN